MKTIIIFRKKTAMVAEEDDGIPENNFLYGLSISNKAYYLHI